MPRTTGADAVNPVASIDQRWKAGMKRMHLQLESTPHSRSATFTTAEAWLMATKHLKIRHLDDRTPRPEQAKDEIFKAYSIIKEAKLMQKLFAWYLDMLQQHRHLLKDDIVPRIEAWQRAKDPNMASEVIVRLVQWKTEWYRETGGFSHHGIDAYWPFRRTFRAILLSTLPSSFSSLLSAVLVKSFAETETAKPGNRAGLADALDQMGILDDFKSLISSAVTTEMENFIQETCPGVRTERQIPMLKTWFSNKVKPWIADIWGKERPDISYRKFEQQMLVLLCQLRISELFEIIVDYEDKTHPLPVLQDLKDCLARTGLRRELVKELREALLQPGAATSDILEQYVSTIKVLRYLDPPGVLLYGVADPIRQYLRDRPDTIKIIVSNLIPRQKKEKDKTINPDESMDLDDDEKEGFLLDEQNEPTPIQATEEIYEDYSDPKWMPAANDAEPGFRVQKPSDIISTLVSIFGSKDLFVKELQIIFGQRLLAIQDGNYDTETHNLEILKIRFGDSALQVCDVMMKDLRDSRRTNNLVNAEVHTTLQPTIVSRVYWPPMPKASLQMPGQFQEMQKKYQTEFELQKQDKKLRWLPNIGSVTLTVNMDDGQDVSLTVTPLQAAVIELFSDTPQWHVEELADRLGKLDVTSVALALIFWQRQKVLVNESPQVYRLREAGDADAQTTGGDTHMASAMRLDAPEVPEKDLSVYWRYLESMLTKLGPRDTERIHSTLKLAPGPGISLHETALLLDSLRTQGLLRRTERLWSLP